MHPTKWLMWLVLVLLGGWLIWVQTPDSPRSDSPTNPLPEVARVTPQDVAAPLTKAMPSRPTQPGNMLLQAAAAGVFSDDPYLELWSLRTVLYPCSEPDKMTAFFDLYGGASQPQLDWQEQLPLACETHSKNHPHLMATMDQRDWKADIEPTSALGQQIKHHKFISDDASRWEHNLDLIKQSIRAENSALLLHYSRLIAIMTLDPKDFAEVIQSQDRRHVWQVLELAIQVTACGFQDGMTCAQEAGHMASICASNAAACGLDFMTWYGQNTLPGMQQEVELMAEYLVELSQ